MRDSFRKLHVLMFEDFLETQSLDRIHDQDAVDEVLGI